MIGIEIKDGRNSILKDLQRNRIFAIPAGEHVVRFLPPYITEKKHVDEVIGLLKSILK